MYKRLHDFVKQTNKNSFQCYSKDMSNAKKQNSETYDLVKWFVAGTAFRGEIN